MDGLGRTKQPWKVEEEAAGGSARQLCGKGPP